MNSVAERVALKMLAQARKDLLEKGKITDTMAVVKGEAEVINSQPSFATALHAPEFLAALALITELDALILCNEAWTATSDNAGDKRRPSEREDRRECIIVEWKGLDKELHCIRQTFNRTETGIEFEPPQVDEHTKANSRRLAKAFE